MGNYTNEGVLLAAALVNSDCGRKGELLSTGEDLRRLLADHGWDAGDITEEDARQARALRPALREVFTAACEEEAMRAVNRLLGASCCRPRLTVGQDGLRVEFAFVGPLVQRLRGAAATGLAEVLVAGGLERMRTCADAVCTDVFVDASRNRSRRYCRQDRCGNRNHVAAYRARLRRECAAGSH